MKWINDLKETLHTKNDDDEFYDKIINYRKLLSRLELTSQQLNKHLCKACMNDKYEYSIACLSLGADPNSDIFGYLSPLCSAMDVQNEDMALLLLYSGANPNVKKGLAFRSACYSKNSFLIESFFIHGFDYKKAYITDFFKKTINSPEYKEIKMLLNKYIDID
jgi:ankyrin repeat protein